MGRLSGKKVIISGAAGGMGQVACRRFAAEGATILATDLNAAVKTEIEGLAPGAITYVAADMADSGAPRRLADHAARLLGHVDVLYPRAGAARIYPRYQGFRLSDEGDDGLFQGRRDWRPAGKSPGR